MTPAESTELKKALRLVPALLPEIKILFKQHRLHVSFADELSKKDEIDQLVNFAQELYRCFNEIDSKKEVHITQAFAKWMINSCRFDYEDNLIYQLLYRDVREAYK